MFDDLYIPWTPRLGGLRATAPAALALKITTPGVCTRTLHIAKAIIADALKPFPEAAQAIGAAFLAYYRGQLDIQSILERPAFSEDPRTGGIT
jgi:hypothetical protein